MAKQGATLNIRDSKQTTALIHAEADALKVVADTVGLRRNQPRKHRSQPNDDDRSDAYGRGDGMMVDGIEPAIVTSAKRACGLPLSET